MRSAYNISDPSSFKGDSLELKALPSKVFKGDIVNLDPVLRSQERVPNGGFQPYMVISRALGKTKSLKSGFYFI
ncbi:hypothetical protein NIES4103_27980 [Nostoc sp. NIES-4103]|nr:hypothetical protein NIES4103_27980 [Nostoc sp. NIES-4103]